MSDPVFCVNHPNVPTSLRCNRCGSPICSRCALRTPVGYRCKSCVKHQQTVFYNALWYDYVIAGAIALGISVIAQVILVVLPFFLLAMFAGPLVGWLIFELARRATGKRRGPFMGVVVAACITLVGLPALFILLIGQDFTGLLVNGIYLALAAGSAFVWLRVDQR